MQNKRSMAILLLTFLLVLMSRTIADSPAITLITMDEHGKPLFAQQLEWWYDDNSATKTVLNCAPKACDT